jgi:hypothetical protein
MRIETGDDGVGERKREWEGPRSELEMESVGEGGRTRKRATYTLTRGVNHSDISDQTENIMAGIDGERLYCFSCLWAGSATVETENDYSLDADHCL